MYSCYCTSCLSTAYNAITARHAGSACHDDPAVLASIHVAMLASMLAMLTMLFVFAITVIAMRPYFLSFHCSYAVSARHATSFRHAAVVARYALSGRYSVSASHAVSAACSMLPCLLLIVLPMLLH